MEPVYYESREFSSYRELCEMYEIEYSALIKNLSDGKPLAQSLIIGKDIAKKSCVSGRVCYLAGERYSSLKNLCAFWGLPYNSVVMALKKNPSLEDVWLRYKPLKTALYEVSPFNVPTTYETEFEFCSDYKLHLQEYELYRSARLSPYEALQLCNVTPENYSLLSFSVSPQLLCRKLGITYASYNKLRQRGYSHEDALAKRLLNPQLYYDGPYTYKGTSFADLRSLCEAENCSYKKMLRIYHKTNNLEEAVEAAKERGQYQELSKKARPIRVDGKEYPSQRAYCREHNIKLGSFQAKVRSGKLSFEYIDELEDPE